MKWIPHPFECDTVLLTRWDLVKLFCGRRLQDGGCRVKVGRYRTPVLRLFWWDAKRRSYKP